VRKLRSATPRAPELAPVKAKALADTGAFMPCIPEHMALQLKLATESVRAVSSLMAGTGMSSMFGPIRVSLGS